MFSFNKKPRVTLYKRENVKGRMRNPFNIRYKKQNETRLTNQSQIQRKNGKSNFKELTSDKHPKQ